MFTIYSTVEKDPVDQYCMFTIYSTVEKGPGWSTSTANMSTGRMVPT